MISRHTGILVLFLVACICLGMIFAWAFHATPGSSDFSAETKDAAEYHKLANAAKSAQSEVDAWAKWKLAKCKAKGKVLILDPTGDPACSDAPKPAAATAPAQQPDQQAVGIKGAVTVPKK